MDILNCRDLLASLSDLGDEEVDEEDLWVSAEMRTRVESTCAIAVVVTWLWRYPEAFDWIILAILYFEII